MIDWELPKRELLQRDSPPEGHLYSAPRWFVDSDRFPKDPMVRYREYLSPDSRRSLLAFVKYNEDPSRSAGLVEECWIKAIPVVLCFSTPPRKGSAYWPDILRPRSLEIAESGRLIWRPLLSWPCEGRKGLLAALSKWLAHDDLHLPPPVIRLSFSQSMPLLEIRLLLQDLATSAMPCSFKFFSMAWKDGAGVQAEGWSELLAEIGKVQTMHREKEKIIPLFPEAGSGQRV
jgi:hypothetical protein